MSTQAILDAGVADVIARHNISQSFGVVTSHVKILPDGQNNGVSYPFGVRSEKGDDAAEVVRKYLTSFEEYISGGTQAIVWRQAPQLEFERDFETQTKRWQVYSRLAIFTDRTILDHIVQEETA